MKTNRKLVSKSAGVTGSAGSGQSNVVAQAGYDNVCDVGSSVPSKIQCVRRSSSVPCRGPRSHVVMSVPPNTRCAGQLNSMPCHGQGLEVFGMLDVDCQLLSQSTHGDNVNIHLGAPDERYHRADDVADTDGFPNRSSELNNKMIGRTLDKSLLLAEIIYVDSHVPPAHHQSTNTLEVVSIAVSIVEPYTDSKIILYLDVIVLLGLRNISNFCMKLSYTISFRKEVSGIPTIKWSGVGQEENSLVVDLLGPTLESMRKQPDRTRYQTPKDLMGDSFDQTKGTKWNPRYKTEECLSFLLDESHLGRMKVAHMLKYIGDTTEPIREVITSAMAEKAATTTERAAMRSSTALGHIFGRIPKNLLDRVSQLH
ncbi:hypothetical protein Tco_0966064 [Tanacetum coccineum]